MAKKEPVFKAKEGPLSIAVWENAGKNGTFPNVSGIERRYKDQSGEFKSTASLRAHDLAGAQKLLAQAEAFCKKTYPDSIRG